MFRQAVMATEAASTASAAGRMAFMVLFEDNFLLSGSINWSDNRGQFTLKGTYAVQSTGVGSATLNGTTTSDPCSANSSFSTPVSIVIGQRGATSIS